MQKITGQRISVISILFAIILTVLSYFMSNSTGRLPFWILLWTPFGLTALYAFAYDTRPKFRMFHHENKYLIYLVVLVIISLTISFVRYYMEGVFSDRIEAFAYELNLRLFKPGFLDWFLAYEYEHKFRILFPLTMVFVGYVMALTPDTTGILISLSSTILCLKYISEICKLREFSDSDRYTVLYAFISSTTIITNAVRPLTDVFSLLLVIMCFFHYISYNKNGKYSDLLITWVTMFLAIAARETSALLPFILWIVPMKRLDWRKRTLIFLVPIANAFAIFIRRFPYRWALLKLSPICYRRDNPILETMHCFFIQRFIETHFKVDFLLKWIESLVLFLLIPIAIATFAIPFREILRNKFRDHVDLVWAGAFIVILFVIRSDRVFDRYLLPSGWVFFLWIPQGIHQFLNKFRFQKNHYWLIVVFIVLSGYTITFIRIAVGYFDILGWIRYLHP